MKEVTRVHIAKTTYEMEIEAKKALAAYLDTIKQYTGDDELVGDVETRIVELLAERGVKKNRVVTHEDIMAITGQLGAPEEFAEDGDIATGSSDIGTSNKKLYRDSGGAWVGGIAAGLARYFGTRAWWIRIVFVLSVVLTSGISILIYVLLWLVLPATKNSGDVLRLEGKPVTIAGMNAMNGDAVRPARDMKIVRVLSVITGIGLLLTAFGAMVVFVLGYFTYGLQFGRDLDLAFPAWYQTTAAPWFLGFAGAGGILGFAFLLLAGYLLISWRFKRATVITLIVIFVLGVISATGALGTAIAGRQQIEQRINLNTISRNVALPSLSSVTKLALTNNSDTHVSYVVTSGDKPRIEVTTLRGTKDPEFAINGDTLAVTVPQTDTSSIRQAYFPGGSVTIYGPALTNVAVSNGQLFFDGSSRAIGPLTATVGANASLNAYAVTVTDLTATLGQYANLSMNDGNVQNATITADQLAGAQFGTLKSLAITAPETCANGISTTTITAAGVTAGSFILNGASYGVQEYSTNCVTVSFDANGKYED